eukprot:CAMPEP_0113621954 /NCGR_PEP_ID=MMETSP0017_2-20120614/11236_1 /TAXON_ID=2856 /ORGANISM="Cylindrotheca closterium" /LENGTH=311 /DNA_ID=CAMNT_0000531745 /DNA_START=79 /DNA_END=1014 /DNA_ORIENTATION=+ /assembly_acc=CAM_ASM_000147
MEKDDLPKSPPRTPSSGSDDTDDEEEMTAGKEGNANPSLSASSADENVLKNRREKRLAMNRASARARRRRKKDLLSTLAAQVQELKNQNQILQTKHETATARVEQLESALTQAQATITALSSGTPSMHSSVYQPLTAASPSAAAVSQMSDSALRSFLLGAGGAGAGLSGASGLSGGLSASSATAPYGDSLLNARAVQQLELQNQLKLLGATSGLGASGLGAGLQASALQQQLASDRIGSLAGVSGLGSLLGGGLGQGMPPGASQLDNLVRAKAMEQPKDGKRTSTIVEESKFGAAGAGMITDGPPAKKPKI